VDDEVHIIVEALSRRLLHDDAITAEATGAPAETTDH
jgi:hypothetical protein